MKKRNLIYLASTAVLMVASAQQVLADAHETTNSEAAVGANLTDKQTAATGTSHTVENTYSAPAVDPSEQKSAAKESQQPASETTEIKTTVPQKNESVDETKDKKDETGASSAEKEIPSSKGESSFFDSHSTATKPSKVEAKGSFVDVSSHNGDISVADYKELVRQGVSGVVVKLTEGTFYKNPYAQGQIRNAQQAGLKVSAYAFSHYTNETEARAEAQYFAQRVRELNLPAATVLVNDIEDHDMERNINPNTQAWTDEMKRLGFSNLVYYTSAAWLDVNNLRNRGPIQTSKFGLQNFWVAQYPAGNLNVPKAQELNYNNGAAGWQFTSQAQLLVGKHVFDQSLDYTGRFTNHALPDTHGAGTLAKATGAVNIANNNLQTGNFDVVITNVSSPAGVREVKVPIWSTANSRVSTLKWYTATRQVDGSYRLHVKVAYHQNVTGKYFIDIYYVDNNGKLEYVTGTTVNISKKTYNTPYFSQRDNRWRYRTYGIYNMDATGCVPTALAMAISGVKGKTVLPAEVADYLYNHTNSFNKTSIGTDGYGVKYGAEHWGLEVQVLGTSSALVNALEDGHHVLAAVGNSLFVRYPATHELLLSGYENGKTYVRDPYNAANNGWYSISDLVNIKSTDLMDLSLGSPFVAVKEVIKISGKVTVTNNNTQTGSFDVVISEAAAPNGVREIRVPVWSGADTLIWYTANRHADGSYRVHVESSTHKNATGKYYIDVYALGNNGQLTYLTGTTMNVKRNEPIL